jgi:hypothetical protein
MKNQAPLRSMVSVLVCQLLLTACTPPGEGPKALAGFKASAAILQGLGDYHSKNAAYPSKLDVLVPAFLSSTQLAPPPPVASYDYSQKGGGFTFSFRYHGPGTNTCTFDSALRHWDCAGHF